MPVLDNNFMSVDNTQQTLGNDEKSMKFIAEWQKYITEAQKALAEANFAIYDEMIGKATYVYEQLKEYSNLHYECKNFGMANYVFENALPILFKKNTQAVKEFISTIKEDKNLHTQFKFYSAMKNADKHGNLETYINEALDIALNEMDVKSVNASNKKLGTIIEKYNIRPTEPISESYIKYAQACDYLLRHPKKLTNLVSINENKKVVKSFILGEIVDDTMLTVESFYKKYGQMLTEDEKFNFRKAIEESNSLEKKRNFYNNLKENCLKMIASLMESASDEEKVGLEEIQHQLSSRMFNEGSLVEDVAKLLEVRDILSEK